MIKIASLDRNKWLCSTIFPSRQKVFPLKLSLSSLICQSTALSLFLSFCFPFNLKNCRETFWEETEVCESPSLVPVLFPFLIPLPSSKELFFIINKLWPAPPFRLGVLCHLGSFFVFSSLSPLVPQSRCSARRSFFAFRANLFCSILSLSLSIFHFCGVTNAHVSPVPRPSFIPRHPLSLESWSQETWKSILCSLCYREARTVWNQHRSQINMIFRNIAIVFQDLLSGIRKNIWFRRKGMRKQPLTETVRSWMAESEKTGGAISWHRAMKE